MMEIYKILDKNCCSVDLKAKTKEDALKRLADLAVKSPLLDGVSSETVFQELKAREDQGSTGFGDGLAIPHARIEGMKDFLLFCVVSRKGVEFDALDKKKVKLFFVILGPPEEVEGHLKILAGVSRAVSTQAIRNELMKSISRTALSEAFLRHLRVSGGPGAEQRKMKLMTVILYLDEFLYDILELFIQEGIEGATILESSGMGEYISNVPLFAGFLGFMSEKKNRSKTILAMIPEDQEAELIRGIEEITGDLDKKQGAMIMTQEISFFKGSMDMV